MTNSHSEKRPPSPTFTDFMRQHVRFIVDPIVSVLAALGISPDTLTFLGLVAHFGFAWMVLNVSLPVTSLVIFFIGPIDNLDGALARKLGRAKGGFGAFLDSTVDRIAETVLFAAFVFYFIRLGQPTYAMAAFAALTGSLLVSYTRARAESLGFDCKIGLLSRLERYGVLCALLLFNRPDWAMMALALGTWFTVGQRVLHVWRQASANS